MNLCYILTLHSKFQIGFDNIQYMQISAILSDYDGTLVPTASIHSSNIPNEWFGQTLELEKVLWQISNKIPIGIISTKDFNFLHYRTRYANILSCMMSIETIILEHIESDSCEKYNCVKKSMLNIDSKILNKNSQKLVNIINKIFSKLQDLSTERKLTLKSNLLAGITIDWRHLDDWNSIKKRVEPTILKMVNEEIEHDNNSKHPLFVQTYLTHPFIDIYSSVCSKEIAYDNLCRIIKLHINKLENKNIIYFGDSENDNPAFKKADISIGIKSDERLNPKLDCQYVMNFNQLPKFLIKLLKNDLIFSENLL